jgi:arylsulfatase A-like enzyme
MKYERTLTLAVWSLFAAVAAAAPGAVADDRPPNVVFILADDLGWTDLGCMGSGYYRTPRIDALAAQGVKFTDAYTCGPNCQPTRAALMSGRYGPRTGVYTVGGTDRFDSSMRPLAPVENVTRLDTGIPTFAESLKKAGYATALFGKWHLGEDPQHHPLARGFDESVVSMGRHFDFKVNPPAAVPEGAYLADYLTDRAVGFIEKHRDAPFLLCLHHFGVHAPYEAKDDLIASFRDRKPAGGHHDPTYAAMIASVDESVGRVVDTLDRLDLSRRTLVIFTSDNGGVGGYAEIGAVGKGITDNSPLRGGKGMLYEGGVRVPWIARWPGTTPAGAVSAEPILSVDLYPTLLDLAGAKPAPGQVLDGVSIAPLLRAKDGAATLGRDAIYWHFPGYLGSGRDIWRTTPAGAIRSGNLKLIEFFETGKAELYDLAADPGQARDLAAERPDAARDLLAKLRAWRAEVKAPMPAKRPQAEIDAARRAPEPAKTKGAAKKGAARKKAAAKAKNPS